MSEAVWSAHEIDPACLLAADEVPPATVLLAAVDGPAGMPGQWVDAGLSVWSREANRVAYQHACWVLETSRAQAGTSVRVLDRPRSGKVVAASLGWSEGYADYRIEFARQILERLPALGEAMAAGVLEERKALIFTTTLADLDEAQARVVVERLLAQAPGLAFGRLRTRVEQTAQAVDPGWAAARRAAAIARRRVGFRVAPSGAAELCGWDQPEEAAQDAHDRIVALGRAVAHRLRALGLSAPRGPIESEVMLTLTGPAGAGLWDGDVVEHVVARFAGPDGDPGDPSDPGPDGGPDGGGPDGGGPQDARPDDDDESDAPERSDLDDPEEAPAEEAPTHAEAAVPFVARVALRIGLLTVLGLDRRPGEIPGRGVVPSAVARAMAWARTDGPWRLLLHDPDGHLEHVLLMRPPHRGPPAIFGRRRHHVVEVTASTVQLDTLHAALTAAHFCRGTGPQVPPAPAAVGCAVAAVGVDVLGVLDRAARALHRARTQPAEDHPAFSTADAARRFPGAALRAWVQARDRTCRAPGCAADAVTCDLDHTLGWKNGGRTVAGDLGAFCRRDHVFKHDPATGWAVTQTRPGHFTWTAPTGRVHRIVPECYDPLPEPLAPADGSGASFPSELLDPPPPEPPPGSPRRNRHGLLTHAATTTSARLHRRARGEPEAVEKPGPDDPPPF